MNIIFIFLILFVILYKLFAFSVLGAIIFSLILVFLSPFILSAVAFLGVAFYGLILFIVGFVGVSFVETVRWIKSKGGRSKFGKN